MLSTLTNFQTEANAIADLCAQSLALRSIGDSMASERSLRHAESRQTLLDAAIKIASMESSGRMPLLTPSEPMNEAFRQRAELALYRANKRAQKIAVFDTEDSGDLEADLNANNRLITYTESVLQAPELSRAGAGVVGWAAVMALIVATGLVWLLVYAMAGH